MGLTPSLSHLFWGLLHDPGSLGREVEKEMKLPRLISVSRQEDPPFACPCDLPSPIVL